MNDESTVPPGPRMVGHFEIRRLLGKGGMGEVHEGFDTKLQRRVAVKTISRKRRLDELSKTRFLREARILSLLDHPHICRVFEYIEGTEQDTLVLEFIEGRSLGAAIREGLDDDLKMAVAQQTAEALVAAHERGIVHRDLKPENIMLDSKGQVKVLDFGISRYEGSPSPVTRSGDNQLTVVMDDKPDEGKRHDDPEESLTESETIPGFAIQREEDSEASQYTRPGELIGTLGYMSPEQAAGSELTTASDMYSFGLVLHELYTGEKVFDKQAGILEIVLRTQEGDLPKVEGVNAALAQLITDLESLNPSHRPTSAEALRRLKWIADKPRRRRRHTLAAAGVTFLVLVALSLGVLSVRLEHEVARANTESEAAQQTSEFLQGLFRASAPTEALGRELTARELLDRGVRRLATSLKDQPLIRARLLSYIGNIYRNLGHNDEAEKLLLEALNIRKGMLPPDDTHIADTEYYLAKTVMAADRTDDAIAYLEQCRTIFVQAGKRGQADAARVEAVLANLYHLKGDPRAEAMGKQALAATAQADPTWNPRVRIDALYQLGTYLGEAGRFEDAEKVMKEAREEAERLLPENDPDLASILDQLASLYSETGRFDEAEPLLEKGLAIREEVLGEDHFDLAVSLSNLGNTDVRLGRYAKAERLLNRALRISEKTSGADSIKTAMVLCNLGNAFRGLGHNEEASKQYEKALKIFLVADPHDRRLSQIYINLSNSQSTLGRLNDAKESLLKAGTFISGESSQDRADLGLIKNNLAEVYERMGRYDEALPLYKQALALFKEVYGDNHYVLGEVLRGTAVVLADLGDWDEAEVTARRADKILEAALGHDHDLTARNRALLARIFVATGRGAKALPIYEDAIKVFEKTFGKESSELVPLLQGYAKALATVGRTEDAKGARSRAAAIHKRELSAQER